jgi:hypothetical protein
MPLERELLLLHLGIPSGTARSFNPATMKRPGQHIDHLSTCLLLQCINIISLGSNLPGLEMHTTRTPHIRHQNVANMLPTRKKYRKMRIKFDAKMQESNNLCAKEQHGAGTAKRLAQENESVESYVSCKRI